MISCSSASPHSLGRGKVAGAASLTRTRSSGRARLTLCRSAGLIVCVCAPTQATYWPLASLVTHSYAIRALVPKPAPVLS